MAYMTISIASGVMNSAYGNSQVPIKSYLLKRGEAFEQASALKLLCREQKSNHWAEGYSGETAMGDFEPVGEGGNYPSAGFEESFKQDLVNETWKLSFSVTQEMVEDNQIGEMKKRANKLVTSYNRTREMFMRYLYVGGMSQTSVGVGTKSFKCSSADQLSLFNTQHINKVNKKKQCNKYSDAFSADMLGKVETEMQNRVGDNGELLGITPNTIWIPNDAALKDQVFAAIGADKDPDTNNNGYNYHFGRWNVVVDPYLTLALQKLGVSQLPWFLLDSQFIQDADGAILQNRVPLNIKSDMDANNDNNLWKGRARFTGGFVDWRFCSVGNASGGTSLA